MDEKCEYIINEVGKLFTRYGIKNLSMDDIARELGISKKTLYLYFSDKSDLVNKVVDQSLEETNCEMSKDPLKGKTAIDMLLYVSSYLISRFSQVHPMLNFELRKYYPEAAERVKQHRYVHVLSKIEQNLKRGMEEGWYRKDLNVKIIAYYYLKWMESFFEQNPDEQYLKGIKREDMLRELFAYHLHGVLNEKGLKEFYKRIKEQENETFEN